jgi:hypothetical protein
MSEDRDFIDEMQHEAELRFGGKLTAREAAEKFAGHDLEGRIQHLKNLRRSDDPLTTTEMRSEVERRNIERALRSTHERLRKIGR